MLLLPCKLNVWLSGRGDAVDDFAFGQDFAIDDLELGLFLQGGSALGGCREAEMLSRSKGAVGEQRCRFSGKGAEVEISEDTR